MEAWTDIEDADAATCETKRSEYMAANPMLDQYTFCAGFKIVDDVKYCGYYYAKTSDSPVDIREGLSETAGVEFWMASFIGSVTPQSDLGGVPITEMAQARRDMERA